MPPASPHTRGFRGQRKVCRLSLLPVSVVLAHDPWKGRCQSLRFKIKALDARNRGAFCPSLGKSAFTRGAQGGALRRPRVPGGQRLQICPASPSGSSRVLAGRRGCRPTPRRREHRQGLPRGRWQPRDALPPRLRLGGRKSSRPRGSEAEGKGGRPLGSGAARPAWERSRGKGACRPLTGAAAAAAAPPRRCRRHSRGRSAARHGQERGRGRRECRGGAAGDRYPRAAWGGLVGAERGRAGGDPVPRSP